MNSIVGIILIAGGIFLGYLGYNKLQESKAEIKIVNIEISAQDKDAKRDGYLLLGGGILCILVGAVIIGRRKR
ncbi:MAG: hypothetical protein WCF67_05380 [Chitinophagaceae bacterium]